MIMDSVVNSTNHNTSILSLPTGTIGSLRKNNGYHSSPGIISSISLFSSLIDDIKFLIYSWKTKDNEGRLEGWIRVFNLPIGIASSLERLISFFMALASGITLITLSLSAAVTGFVFLAIEFGLELWRLIRTLNFSHEYAIGKTHNLIKELDNKKTNLEKFRKKHGFAPTDSKSAMQTELADRSIKRIHNDYFNTTTSGKQLIMTSRLDRIIRPFAVEILRKDNLCPKIEKKELIKLLNSQINKTILVNIVGLTAILLATASLALCFIGFPPMIFVTLGLIGFAIEFSRYLAPPILLDHRGWHPNFYECLPQCCQPKSLSV